MKSVSSVVQQKFVRRVEGLFAPADRLEVRLAKARGQVDKLTPVRHRRMLSIKDWKS